MDQGENEPKEQNLSSSPPPKKSKMTLQEAIEFGEYDPNVLQNFAEWHTLSVHIQWQLIRKALDIRHRQLISQYAELSNALDFSKKPHLRDAMKNVQRQLEKLRDDKEQLYVEYSNKM